MFCGFKSTYEDECNNTMVQLSDKPVSYSQFACIGTGFSAIALGATLKRWYGIEDITFFERHQNLGGTWFISQYPGMSHLYGPLSFSSYHRQQASRSFLLWELS